MVSYILGASWTEPEPEKTLPLCSVTRYSSFILLSPFVNFFNISTEFFICYIFTMLFLSPTLFSDPPNLPNSTPFISPLSFSLSLEQASKQTKTPRNIHTGNTKMKTKIYKQITNKTKNAHSKQYEEKVYKNAILFWVGQLGMGPEVWVICSETSLEKT